MSNNKFLADYAYLAEASYADFSDAVKSSYLKDENTISAIIDEKIKNPSPP